MKSIDKPCANYEKEEHIMARPLADYVKLPGLEEYKEWFKDFADLKREDGILQVTWKTLDGPMHHSGMSHRAIPQLVRVLSLDTENEIIIFTHIGDNWMIESDANGWETYSQLPKQRFQHQYFDDTNLIKNMIFDLDVPTIGVMPGPGFHWDSAFLSDVTIVTEDTKIEVPHAQGGLVPGDGMGLMMQHYLGTKRGAYYMMTSRQITAQQILDAGMVSEVVAKGKGLERADENSEQQDEKYISRVNDYRYATTDMEQPMTLELWAGMAKRAAEWFKKVESGEIPNPYEYEHSNEPDWYKF